MDKPKIVISSCLLGENVRYNGKVLNNPIGITLKDYFQFIPVCPEVSIGLPVPRKKIFLVFENGSYKVYEEGTGRDLTEDLINFSKNFLKNIKSIDGFLLKSKSPSCGIKGTKCYKEKNGKRIIGRRKGLFALEILRKFKNYPVIDEESLKDSIYRYDFFTKVYLIHYYRNMNKERFIRKYRKVLSFFNKKRSKEFIKNPTFENLLNIFTIKLTPKRLYKKTGKDYLDLKFFKEEELIIFQEDLLTKLS